MAEDPEKLRSTIGTAHQNVFVFRVAVNGGNTTLQCAGRDGGDVVDETRVLKDGEFGGHVTPHRYDVLAFHIVCRAKHPIIVGALKENLFTGLGINGAYGVVATAEGYSLAVGRPAGSVDGVKRHRMRHGKGFVFHVPHLYFAHPTGFAAGDREASAVRREPYGFNPFTEAD